MIRDIEEKDKELFITMCGEFYSSLAVSHSVPKSNFERTFDVVTHNSPYYKGYMVEYNGKTVGYGLVQLSYSNEAGGMQMFLDELYIREEYRNKGLGKEFFEHVYSSREDIARYRLEVTAVNERAIALYKRLGYEKLDFIQMIKDIDKNKASE